MNYIIRQAILDALNPIERVKLTAELSGKVAQIGTASPIDGIAISKRVAEIVVQLTEDDAAEEKDTVKDANSSEPIPEDAELWVSEDKFAELSAKVEWYAKRAKKLGVEPMVIEQTGERFVQWWREKETKNKAAFPLKEEPTNGLAYGRWEPVKDSIQRQVKVKIKGNTPMLSGWRFVAAVDHVGKSNVIRAIPGGGDIPNRYKSSSSFCEHCNSNRTRNSTYLVRHTDGTVKQIGSSCMKDFLGHANAAAMAELAAWQSNFWAMVNIDELSGSDYEFEGDDGVRAGAGEREASRYHSLPEYLSFVASSIRHYGWVSRARSSDSYGGLVSTADDAFNIAYDKTGDRKSDYPVEEDKKESNDAIEWAKNLSDAEVAGNDFLRNLKAIAENGAFHVMKHAGIAAAIVMSYQKAQEKLKEAERKAKGGVSNWVGEVGKRQQFERLTVEAVNSFDGQYGTTHIHRFSDDAGNVYVWKSSSGYLDKGKTYNFKATIKEHSDYNGTKQTVLTRVANEEKVEDAK